MAEMEYGLHRAESRRAPRFLLSPEMHADVKLKIVGTQKNITMKGHYLSHPHQLIKQQFVNTDSETKIIYTKEDKSFFLNDITDGWPDFKVKISEIEIQNLADHLNVSDIHFAKARAAMSRGGQTSEKKELASIRNSIHLDCAHPRRELPAVQTYRLKLLQIMQAISTYAETVHGLMMSADFQQAMLITIFPTHLEWKKIEKFLLLEKHYRRYFN